jgi:hypothetical protein
MPYAAHTTFMINRGPRNLGNKLGRRALTLDFSVLRIARATGASRQTVYNWIVGGEVLVPYRPTVERLLDILNAADTADTAWATACQVFNLRA